jgi:uncharacterized protein (DUF433 family)
MQSITFDPIIVPLRTDEYGAIRVGGTRVLLDLVIGEFHRGASPEEIVASYDALSLPDVYAVLACYLRDRGPIDMYLRHREEEARGIRAEIEAAQPARSLRSLLMARTNDNGASASVGSLPVIEPV